MLTISAPCAGYFPDGKFGLCCSPHGKKCDQCGWNPREDRNRRRMLRSGNVPLQIRRKTTKKEDGACTTTATTE